MSIADDAAGIELETANAAALTAAVTAVLEAAGRELPPRTGCVSVVARRPQPGVSIRIGSAAAVAAAAESGDAGGPPMAFDRGGQGLALVLAASVLDAHHSDVRQASAAGGVSITLPEERGSR